MHFRNSPCISLYIAEVIHPEILLEFLSGFFLWDPSIHLEIWHEILPAIPTKISVQFQETFFHRDLEYLSEILPEISLWVAFRNKKKIKNFQK